MLAGCRLNCRVIGYDYCPASSSKMDKDKNYYKTKGYIHFDPKIPHKKIKHLIETPQWIQQHAFYPFIYFKIKMKKYSKKSQERTTKTRDILYASHVDSYIYKYYGDYLNNRYNEKLSDAGIHNNPIAYRNNMNGKSNIDFAKEVIDFIVQNEHCYIYVADFQDFFGSLDHNYLKKRIESMLDVSLLSKDFYKVFRSITKYSYVDRETIERYILNKGFSKQELAKFSRYFTPQEFRDFKQGKIVKNKHGYGIPQGASISAVCSNVYMFDFDLQIVNFVNSMNGLYRRYSDDMIVVLPINDINDKESVVNKFEAILNAAKEDTPCLTIHPDKTRRYIYQDNSLFDVEINSNKKILDYLGFSFDGEAVKLREKSLFKYYSRAYKKVKQANYILKSYKRKGYRKSLYKNYTHLGQRSNKYGNFVTYAKRAQEKFDKDALTVNKIYHPVKNHWTRIQRRLDN